jgi:hypothetical protein
MDGSWKVLEKLAVLSWYWLETGQETPLWSFTMQKSVSWSWAKNETKQNKKLHRKHKHWLKFFAVFIIIIIIIIIIISGRESE